MTKVNLSDPNVQAALSEAFRKGYAAAGNEISSVNPFEPRSYYVIDPKKIGLTIAVLFDGSVRVTVDLNQIESPDDLMQTTRYPTSQVIEDRKKIVDHLDSDRGWAESVDGVANIHTYRI